MRDSRVNDSLISVIGMTNKEMVASGSVGDSAGAVMGDTHSDSRHQSLEEVERTVKSLVASHLNLDIDPQDIDAHEEHFLTNRGFNSIDALELLITVEQEFGIEIDDEDLDASL